MKALLLAAGLGIRLQPITNSMPKALVVAEGKTLLEHSLDHLRSNGIVEVIINVHHFPMMIREFLQRNHNFGMEITISDESDVLLETGGGLKKAGWFFDNGKPFVVRNADVLSDMDLGLMLASHLEKGNLATLAVRDRKTSRYFLFDESMKLSGWENRNTAERNISRPASMYMPLAFSGIQILNPDIFPLIIETGKFSLTELYLRLSAFQSISGYIDNDSYWKDVGKG